MRGKCCERVLVGAWELLREGARGCMGNAARGCSWVRESCCGGARTCALAAPVGRAGDRCRQQQDIQRRQDPSFRFITHVMAQTFSLVTSISLKG